jgi:hypothetical protein
MGTYSSLSISLLPPSNPLLTREVEILASRIEERSGIKVTRGAKSDCIVELDVQKGIGKDAFRISHPASGRVRIVGDDERGLLYGIGKFLRTNVYRKGSVHLGDWTGTSVPESPVRGIYFATHFHNFYQEAPTDQINRYVEDLALWGYNLVEVWFDMHQFNGIEDPAAQAMIDRLNLLLAAAKNLGLDTGLLVIANEAYNNSPKELRADWTPGHDGYFKALMAHYHRELCPHKPGARPLLLQWREETFRAFHKAAVNYVTIWSYDPGGCTNTACRPWGANGFLTMARPIAAMAREYFPHCKIILSTWYFDHFTSGEWDMLGEKLNADPPRWLDYIMADETGGLQRFLGHPPKNAVPGNLPLLSFPEISMWGADPWGAFGANPLPEHHQGVWELGKDITAGGLPYSEGIFDDLNKVLYAQFYWNKNRKASETLDEYVAYEFSPAIVEEMRQAISILEKNYPRRIENIDQPVSSVRFAFETQPHAPFRYASSEVPTTFDRKKEAETAFQIFERANAQLPPERRSSWRWRILYLRAFIDDQLVRNNFYVSPECERAFSELVTIYHAQKAVWAVTPPTPEAIRRYQHARKVVSPLEALTYEGGDGSCPTPHHEQNK